MLPFLSPSIVQIRLFSPSLLVLPWWIILWSASSILFLWLWRVYCTVVEDEVELRVPCVGPVKLVVSTLRNNVQRGNRGFPRTFGANTSSLPPQTNSPDGKTSSVAAWSDTSTSICWTLWSCYRMSRDTSISVDPVFVGIPFPPFWWQWLLHSSDCCLLPTAVDIVCVGPYSPVKRRWWGKSPRRYGQGVPYTDSSGIKSGHNIGPRKGLVIGCLGQSFKCDDIFVTRALGLHDINSEQWAPSE